MFSFAASLIPPWFRWAALAALLATAGVWHLVQVQRADARGYARAQAEQATAVAQAQAAARAQEQALAAVNQKVSQAHAQTRQQAASAAAAAAAERDRLLGLLNGATGGGGPTPPATPGARSDDAPNARHLLGHCASALVALAADADTCESRLSGLQDYVRQVVRPPGLAAPVQPPAPPAPPARGD